MTTWQSEEAFVDAIARLEWEIQRLQLRDKEWTSAKHSVRILQDRQSKAERAFSFVYLSGALEDLFRRLNLDLPDDLKRVSIRARDLRPYALSMVFPNAWDNMNTDRVARIVKRKDLVEVINGFYANPDPIDLSSIFKLGISDGRTVDIQNFEALWEGLCLSPTGSTVWKTPAHQQAVRTIHDKRNLIAHFETDPRDEAFRVTYGDLARLATHVLESVQRLQEHTLVWLDKYETKP